jgi:KDO2-lipid IV(A) lauroyltransferase
MHYIFYKFETELVCHLSEANADRFARFYARLWHTFDTTRKQIVRKNLKSLSPYLAKPLGEEEINQLTYSTFLHFARYLVEVFRLPITTAEDLKSKLLPLDTSELDKVLAEGKGVILYSAHFGNWELSGAAMTSLGYDFTTVALPQKDARLEKMFSNWRTQHNMHIITMGPASGMKCLRTLKQGRLLALIADENYGEGKVEIDFLGEKMLLPAGPAQLSRLTGAPVIPGVMSRMPGHKFKINLARPIYPIQTEDAQSDLKSLTQQYMEALQPWFLEYPDQWYRFRS